MLVEKILEEKAKKIHRSPCHTNRASQLGDPCERYLVLERTRWQEKALHDVTLQLIFDQGMNEERAVLRDLDDAGLQVIEQQSDFAYQPFQITGHLDGKVVMDGVAYPIEIKSCSPWVFKTVNTMQDLLTAKYRHLQRYPAQMQMYLLLANAEKGYLIFKNKVTGALKELEVTLDLEYAEGLLKKAERINAHVAAGTLPERIPYDDRICGQCPYLAICLPDVKRDALEITTDPELEAKLTRRQELTAARTEYESLDAEVKAVLKEHDKIMVGDFLVTGRYQDRKDGKKVWMTKIDLLQPAKGEAV